MSIKEKINELKPYKAIVKRNFLRKICHTNKVKLA